jgi:predicted nucleotidyltransferase component of viral defense system
LFTPNAEEVDRLVEALTTALRNVGAAVEADRRGPGFTRLAITMPDGAAVAVEVAHDARIRPSVQLAFGSVLHPDEVAADKTLALFGRAAARDLVDVEALSHHYSLERLCALAEEKDAGFDGDVLADALRVVTDG